MSVTNEDLAGLSRSEKLALLARLKRQKGRAGTTFPLSFQQQRMWFIDRLDPGNPANNIFRALVFDGRLAVPALGRALAEIVDRHEALRTTFPMDGDTPRQRVGRPGDPARCDLPVVDLASLPAARRPAEVERLAEEASRRPFDLAHGPLLRAALLRQEAERHVLLLGLHHIVADGWSLALLCGELTALYGGATLPEPALQYPDFAVRQRERLTAERLASELDWWRAHLPLEATLLELPTDRRRPAVESLCGDMEPVEIPADILHGLNALARAAGATLFMTVLAGFEVLLSRFSGQAEFMVGTTVAGRNRPELEGVMGFFADTLVLPAGLTGNPSFRALLARVRASTLGAYSHQELPFERLVEELQPDRTLSHHPLFQVLFGLQNQPAAVVALPGLTLGELAVHRGLAKLDLTLDLAETARGLAGYLEYSTDLFERPTIARMASHLTTLLGAIVADPERAIEELALLTPAEREGILYGFNPQGYASRPPVPELIAQQARRTPGAPAVLVGDERLSYADLNAQANRLARALHRRGVGPDTLVGICLERSLGMMVALLGILKAGAAYVPLDPDYPRERLALMIADTAMPVLITDSRLAGVLPELGSGGPEVLFLDLEQEVLAAEDGGDPAGSIAPEGLAYVIYTSGSTGRPKGVGVPHRALANHASECARHYALGSADRVLQFTSISFDITSEEIFPTWTAGGAVVPRAPGLFPSFGELEELLTRHGVTVVNLPTAYWHEWASELHRAGRRPPASLRLTIVGTEQALPERLAEWLEQNGAETGFANSYASTECTVTALIHLSGPGSLARARAAHRIPVGRPIDNCRVYVLDRRLEPVPVGVPGDVYIAGANVSRGYLHQPERTAASFLPDPFATCGPGGRLYRQGDLGRFLPSGELECLGRSDDQVKVRGYRIEPGEVEAALARHPGVEECVVLVRDDGAAGRRLVAYAAQNPLRRTTAAELRAHLAESLPDYMVPAGLVILDKLPLNSNGKIDRRALRRIDAGEESTGTAAGTAPRSPLEELVLEIWALVLGRQGLGVHDNFFDHGGHSLLATQVIARVRQVLGVDLALRALFEAPTVAGLAAAIEAARREAGGLAAPPITLVRRDGPLVTSFAQQRLWVVDQLAPGSPAYNLADLLRWRGPLDAASLRRALDELVRRHEALRTTFAVVGGQPVQVIAPPAPLALEVVDLRAVSDSGDSGDRGDRASEAEARAVAAGRRPFDLGRGPLFRAVLYRWGTPNTPESEHLLLLAVHHIVSDGTSNRILLRELLALYRAFAAGEPSPLAELPVQYADFAAWQRAWLSGGVLEAQVAYWRQVLAGAPPVLDLPTDRPRPAIETADGARHRFVLAPAELDALVALGRRHGATLFMALLAAYDVLLARLTGADDLVVGWPIAGRGRTELAGIIGFFANMLVQRARLAAGETFTSLLGQVRSAALDAYTYGDLPFELLVEAVHPERHLSHNPIFQVFFVLHRGADGGGFAAIPGVELDLSPAAGGTSLLDLSLVVSLGDGAVDAFFEYKTALFDAPTIARFANGFSRLLNGALAAPDVPFLDLPLLSPAERAELVRAAGDTLSEPGERGARAGDWQLRRSAHEGAAAGVALAGASPASLALEAAGELLTYGDLEIRVDRLAHALRRQGVGRGSLVGICLERRATMVVALLAVMRAGGAYVPLDPTYPAERLGFILEDAGIRLLLSESAVAASLPLHEAEVILLDGDTDFGADEHADGGFPALLADDLAYVLYTSGSTGKPKGVEVRHGGLDNFLRSMAVQPGLKATDTLLAVTTISFDIAGLELYLPLAVGGRVVLAGRAEAADGKRLAALLAGSGATAMQATPATWRLLLASGWTGSPGLKALCGGEALTSELAAELLPRVGSLWNVYGPTETTIWSAVQPVTEPCLAGSIVSIGRPIAATTLHIFDRHLEPVPYGVTGELYIGGAGLARGYLNRPALTAERFVPDPLATEAGDRGGRGERLYRTGDLARRRPNGEVDFLGRADHQVKVRGFRIELGEIEAVLATHPAVAQAVVAVRSVRSGSPARDTAPESAQLVAYVVAAGDGGVPLAVGSLRAALREELPEYMIPSLFVQLPALPLTPNGKVDRKALPAAGDPLGPDRETVAPRTPVEATLAAIWAEVLGLTKFGIHDNFFELGGHSLMATQVISRLEESFRIELGLAAIFKTPTIAALAEAVVARELARADDDVLADLLSQLEA